MGSRDSFIFYRSFFEAIKELPKENQAEIFTAICEFSLNNKEPEFTGISKTVFILIRPNLEANNKKYENGKKPKNKQTGSKPEAKDEQEESKPEGNEDVDVDLNVNKDKGGKHFESMMLFYSKPYSEQEPGFKKMYNELDYNQFSAMLRNLLKDVPKLKTLFNKCMNIGEWITDMERQPYARILLAAQKVTGSKIPDRETGMANRIFMFIPDEFKKANKMMT